MGRRLRRLAQRSSAVVAGHTVAQYRAAACINVVEPCTQKGGGGFVAVFTWGISNNVTR